MNKPFKPSEDFEAIRLAAREQELSEQSANDDFNENIAEAMAAPERPAKTPTNPKKLISHMRGNMETILGDLSARKEHSEQRIATANARYDAAVKQAAAERDVELADASADLEQVAACVGAADAAMSFLLKAEPKGV